MIVRRRPQDAGTTTGYTMAMHQLDFILLHEMVRQQIAAHKVMRGDDAVRGLDALLRVMDHAMAQASTHINRDTRVNELRSL